MLILKTSKQIKQLNLFGFIKSIFFSIRHYKLQQQNPHAIWKLPDSNVLNHAANPSEVVVGGVYLRLFISNPSWTLRKPKEFLSELMDTCLGLGSKPENEVNELVFTKYM